MVRANTVYTKHTMRDEALSLIPHHGDESIDGRLLRGLRQADTLLDSTNHLVGKVDVASLVVMRVLQYMPADTRVVDILQPLYDLIEQRSNDIAQADRTVS